MTPIRTQREPYAYWMAWRGDYDLGILTGMGETEEEAIAELLEKEEERNQ